MSFLNTLSKLKRLVNNHTYSKLLQNFHICVAKAVLLQKALKAVICKNKSTPISLLANKISHKSLVSPRSTDCIKLNHF